MGNHRNKKPQRRSDRRRTWITVAALAVLALGGGAYWWTTVAPEPVGGTPRLVLDREVIDAGYVPFDSPVNAVFTLTNTGDGVLRLAEVPRVQVRAGC